MTRQEKAPTVPALATQGAEAGNDRDWSWVEASVWTERMVSALVNGVKGGRWFSLIDKVTLADHKLWSNAFFAQAGLLALYGAWCEARHSR